MWFSIIAVGTSFFFEFSGIISFSSQFIFGGNRGVHFVQWVNG